MTVHVGHAERAVAANELQIYPRCVVVAVRPGVADLPKVIGDVLHQANIARQSLACLLAADTEMADPALREAALELGVPLRFSSAVGTLSELARDAIGQAVSIAGDETISVAIAEQPVDPLQIGRPRGRLAVIGLGPGAAELMVPGGEGRTGACQRCAGL